MILWLRLRSSYCLVDVFAIKQRSRYDRSSYEIGAKAHMCERLRTYIGAVSLFSESMTLEDCSGISNKRAGETPVL